MTNVFLILSSIFFIITIIVLFFINKEVALIIAGSFAVIFYLINKGVSYLKEKNNLY